MFGLRSSSGKMRKENSKLLSELIIYVMRKEKLDVQKNLLFSQTAGLTLTTNSSAFSTLGSLGRETFLLLTLLALIFTEPSER